MKKFELTSEFITNIFGTKLFRIKALIEFGNVKAGELGGFVEKEENLNHEGNAWVCAMMLVCTVMLTTPRCMVLAPNIVQLHFLKQKQEKLV